MIFFFCTCSTQFLRVQEYLDQAKTDEVFASLKERSDADLYAALVIEIVQMAYAKQKPAELALLDQLLAAMASERVVPRDVFEFG